MINGINPRSAIRQQHNLVKAVIKIFSFF